MPSVSPDNARLTGMVSAVRQSHSMFQTTLRGAVAEILAGLGSGVQSMMTMNRIIDAVVQSYLSSSKAQIMEDLGKLSESALDTSKAESSAMTLSGSLIVAEALYKLFAADVERSIERAANSDARAAMDFVRIQLTAGRFVATTEQLIHDMPFNVKDKAGRQLNSAEYVYREANMAYRQQYNTVMVHVLISNGSDKATVNGGSKSGTEIDLMDYDQISSVYFHHNSKSLLQPLD